MKGNVIHRVCLGALWLLCAAVPVSHAETLEDAWLLAARQDPTLRAARSRVDAAQAGLDGARAERRPTLALTASQMHFNETPAFDFNAAGVPATLPLFQGSSVVTTDLRLSLPVYTGGGLSKGIEAAAAGVGAQRHALASTAQHIRMSVAEHYVGVLRADSAVEVARSSVASLEAHERDVRSMHDSGAVAKNDVLAAAVSLADARQRLLQARNGADLARSAYNRALGRPLPTPFELDAALPGIDARLTGESLESLTRLALATREDLKGLTQGAAAQDARAAAARAQSRPQVLLSGGYTSLENDVLNREDFWLVGVGVRWNVFDGGRSRAASSALTRQSAALKAERDHRESLIALAVRQAWLQQRETRERVAVTRSAVAQADENARVVRDRYRNGEGTNTEVLDAETLRSLSRANYENARYDAALADYRLAHATGLL